MSVLGVGFCAVVTPSAAMLNVPTLESPSGGNRIVGPPLAWSPTVSRPWYVLRSGRTLR